MLIAGWAWDPVPLAEQVSRSAQADMAILLGALGLIGLLFAALQFVAEWLDRREWRRQVYEAHQPRPLGETSRGQARRGATGLGGAPLLFDGAGDRRDVSTYPASRPSEARHERGNL